MAHGHRVRIWMGAALVVALAGLGVLILNIFSRGTLPETSPEPSDELTYSPPITTATTLALLGTHISLTAIVTPVPPFEAWAREMLSLAISHAEYQLSDQTFDTLVVSDGQLLIGDRSVNPDDWVTLTLLLPAADDAVSLVAGGSLSRENGSLVLATLGGPTRMVSDAVPSDALRALVTLATASRIRLEATLIEYPNHQAEVVLVARSLLEVSPSASLTPLAVTPMPTLRTPIPALDPALESIVTAKLDPIIDAAPGFSPDSVAYFLEHHSWTGRLTWTESGPRIGERSINVARASSLTFFALQPDDPSAATARFMTITYREDVWETTLPGGRIFYGQRMEEVLYWMARRASERGGQLLVAYDDFGERQAITVIGFRPFE